MNSYEDRINCTGNNDLGQIDLHYLNQVMDLEDIWRRRFPDKNEFTWYGKGKASRIDFWLTSISLNNQIDEISNVYVPFTDHRAIRITLRTIETTRAV